jgi:hypothetical protein
MSVGFGFPSSPRASRNLDGSLKRKYKVLFQLRVGFIALLGGFLMGYNTGIIAGAQLFLDDTCA